MPDATLSEIEERLTDWRKLATSLHARFITKNFAAGLQFVTAVTEAAEAANHHPDVKLTYPWVDITLISHDVNAITSRDLDLAEKVSAIAADQGIEADPRVLSELELALDTADGSAIGPFWAALLGGDSGKLDGEDVTDPRGRMPLLWMQGTDSHETPRQRFHLDVWVPRDVAQSRVEAAIEAGGRLVTDQNAPSFWVLADAEGNQACVCTPADRESD